MHPAMCLADMAGIEVRKAHNTILALASSVHQKIVTHRTRTLQYSGRRDYRLNEAER